jgi:hypothetical protein
VVEQFTQLTAHCAFADRGPGATTRAVRAAPASAKRRMDANRLLESRIVHPLFFKPRERPPLALALRETIEMSDLFLGADAGER